MTKRISKTKPACSVSKTGVEIGELWSAYNAVEATKLHDNIPRVAKEYAALAEQIDSWRETLEVNASFTRAESLSGALVHTVLAQEVVKDLVGKFDPEPDERLMAHSIYRMLSSVALLLRKELGDDFKPLADFWRIYVGNGFEDDQGNPAMWTDKIPTLVAAWKAEQADAKNC